MTNSRDELFRDSVSGLSNFFFLSKRIRYDKEDKSQAQYVF